MEHFKAIFTFILFRCFYNNLFIFNFCFPFNFIICSLCTRQLFKSLNFFRQILIEFFLALFAHKSMLCYAMLSLLILMLDMQIASRKYTHTYKNNILLADAILSMYGLSAWFVYKQKYYKRPVCAFIVRNMCICVCVWHSLSYLP